MRKKNGRDVGGGVGGLGECVCVCVGGGGKWIYLSKNPFSLGEGIFL